MPPLSSPGGVATLGDVGDVDLTGLEDGDGIAFDDPSQEWNAGLPSGEFYELEGNAASGDAGDYTSNGVTENPENVGGVTRQDIWWRADGLKVFTMRGSSPRISQYDVFPAFSINPGPPSDWTPGTPFTGAQAVNGFGMQFNPTGLELSISNSGGSPFMRVYPMSVAFDVTTLGAFTSSFFIGFGGLTRHHWRPDLLKFWVQSTTNILEYSVTNPFSVSPTPTLIFTFDVTADVNNVRGWTFSIDGKFLYAANDTTVRLVSWEMATPYDLSSIINFDGTNGPLLDAGNDFKVPEGFYYRQSDGLLLMGDSLTNFPTANQRMQTLSL